MERRFVVVSFDVACDRRRDRLCRLLQTHGLRVQFSVFECLVRHSDWARFCSDVAACVSADHDRVTMYPLCATCRPRVESWGQPLGRLPEDGWFI